MLIEFSVENFRSFKERMTLSMEANNSPNLLHSNTMQVNKKLRIVKSVAIYGANASGKSNLVKALDFMRNFIIASAKDSQAGEKLHFEPFLLDTSEWKKPSLFELVFLVEETYYRYGFQMNENLIVSEWLFQQKKNTEKQIFTREGNIFSLPPSFKEAHGLEKRTRENALFLSVLAQFNVSVAKSIIYQVERIIAFKDFIIDSIVAKAHLTTDLATEGNNFIEMSSFLKNFNLGFSEIHLRHRTLREGVPKSTFTPFDEFVDAFNDALTASNKNSLPSMYAQHQVIDSDNLGIKTIEFNVNDQESDGTQKIIAFANYFIQALKHGFCIFFDEIDASLHPLLSKKIIELFNNSATNPNGAQLIFTTHDTNLLSRKLLRRDQIWFTEKMPNGATDLYSLADFIVDGKKVRNDASYSKDYILGKYGAIPYIGDFLSVFGGGDE